MYPELFTLPGGITIKTYGFCLMVGFLTAVWLAMRRAAKLNVDPDRALDCALPLLVGGVLGARIFFVVHYWQSQFADRPDLFWAIIDLRQGGLEFLGGLVGGLVAMAVYLKLKRQSIRLFLDIAAPSAMLGLAIGRLGCFFNGCCFGGPCVHPGPQAAKFPWAIRFPYASAAHVRQWEDRLVSLPAELIHTSDQELTAYPVPDSFISMSPERREGPIREFETARRAFEEAERDDPNSPRTAQLKDAMASARKAAERHSSELRSLYQALTFPSRVVPERATVVSDLEDLAKELTSLPIHATQLYASVNAFLLSILLSAILYARRRHGVVIGWLMVLYGVSRFLEETIRTDNPRDVLGLSVSQAMSIGLVLIGLFYFYVLYTRMPQRSPFAEAAAAVAEPATADPSRAA